MDTLLAHFNSIYPLPEALVTYLRGVFRQKEIPAKHYLFWSGQVCEHIYFIERGLLRCFRIDGSKDICTRFLQEGDICISVQSFFRQQCSCENIQALEDSKVYYISYEELQNIYRKFPEFNFVGRVLIEKYYLLLDEQVNAMRAQHAGERYHWLIENFPVLMARLPLKYIASYLGISDVMLSRIRRRA
jgi:CRP/FNR family transcriptional regulator, anaerobic regulatory protein